MSRAAGSAEVPAGYIRHENASTPPYFTLMSPSSSSLPTSSRGSGKWLRLIVGVLIVAILVALSRFIDVRNLLRESMATVAHLGPLGPLLFIGIYVLATVFMVPGSALTLGAGAAFGVVWGSIYVSVASTLGASAAFLVGRHFARAWVSRKIEGNATFRSIDSAVANEGWKIVGLTRLSPVFPFTLLNYAFGLTQVRLRDYIVASWIGMMPGTVMYVYLGSIARAAGEHRTPAEWALYVVGLLATITVTVFVTRIARRALAKRTTADS